MHACNKRSGAFFRACLTRCAVGLSVCAFSPTFVLAGALEEGRSNPRVDEIITTGVRQRPLAQLPRNANVITAADIALSPSANVLDLLAREANLNLRSLFGSTKKGGVDIRGQGDTYASNVLVLIDGVKINSVDQSGADFTSLAMDQIERIEIIRGANTVRYGGGAVGGVINILTKQGEPGAGINVDARAGSYSTVESGLGAYWANDVVSLGGEAGFQNSDGYRDNSELDTDDYAAQLKLTPYNWLAVTLRGDWHRDDYGLPGPVNDGDDPESTDFPFDGGETNDDRSRLNVALGNEESGVLSLNGSKRDRKDRYKIGLTGDVPRPNEIKEDDTRLEIQYDKTVGLFDRSHEFTVGVDLVQTDYSRDQYTSAGDFQDSKVGDIRQTAWFVAGDLEITDKLTLSLGYREDRFKTSGGNYILDCADSDKTDFGLPITPVCTPGAPEFKQPDAKGRQTEVWRNSAVEVGVVYNLSEDTNLYFSYAQSFRNPNVDDLIVADVDGLTSQTSDHYDIGIRQQVGNDLEWGLGLFYSKTDDEILYGLNPADLSLSNRNSAKPVERVGGEADVRWYAASWALLTANAGYTHAKLKETNTYMPLVPEWTAAVGAQFQPVNDMAFAITANYTGKRYDGNDFSNDVYGKLDDYTIVDTRLSYAMSGLMFYAGINNVFEKEYSTTAYSGAFYPMPDRNYYAGITYRMSARN